MKRKLAVLLVISMLTSGVVSCGNAGLSEKKEMQSKEIQTGAMQEETWQTVKEAYTYTLPLVLVKVTLDKMTNTLEATSKQAPWNQLIHAQNLATAQSKDVVTPNVDTIYTQLSLDVGKDAVIFEKPATDRFCSVEVMDAYTNCQAILGTGGDTSEAYTYIFTGPDFNGEIPEGMKEIKLPDRYGWIIIRTICEGEEDIEAVKEIQSRMKSYTLSQYLAGDTDNPPEGTYDADKEYIPVEYMLSLSPEEYFSLANELMESNPPAPEDEEAIEKFKNIGVGPGMKFDTAVLGENAATQWKAMVSGLRAELLESCQSFMVENGIWACFGKPIAEFGVEYEYRALVALAGLGANPVSVAMYPKTQVDSEKNRLNGEHKYILHFEKDALPPVQEDGFWSITAYDSANDLLIDNEMNRYCINDRSKLSYNEDGSLDLYLQEAAPEDEKVSNWLPVCKGDFHLYMRIYLPEDDVVSGSWAAPEIRMVE